MPSPQKKKNARTLEPGNFLLLHLWTRSRFMLSCTECKCRKAAGKGKACRTCCPVHSAVGWAVTLKCRMHDGHGHLFRRTMYLLTPLSAMLKPSLSPLDPISGQLHPQEDVFFQIVKAQ